VALAINIKRYEGKRRIMKNSNIYISPCKNIIFKRKNPLEKKPKSFKILYNAVTNLKFQHKPKISCFKKNPHIKKKRPIIIIIIITT